jgi:hypothetical protein
MYHAPSKGIAYKILIGKIQDETGSKDEGIILGPVI